MRCIKSVSLEDEHDHDDTTYIFNQDNSAALNKVWYEIGDKAALGGNSAAFIQKVSSNRMGLAVPQQTSSININLLLQKQQYQSYV